MTYYTIGIYLRQGVFADFLIFYVGAYQALDISLRAGHIGKTGEDVAICADVKLKVYALGAFFVVAGLPLKFFFHFFIHSTSLLYDGQGSHSASMSLIASA